MQFRPEVVICLLYSFYDGKAEMLIEFAFDEGPRARDRSHAVIEDNSGFRGSRLEFCERTIALQQDLDALEIACN